MTFGQLAGGYAAGIVTFLVLDLTWLGVVAKGFYAEQIGALTKDKVNWTAGLAFYFLYVVGAMVFAVVPALNDGGAVRALLLGAGLGLIAYGTYDLTNLAVAKGWPVPITFVDLAWGGVLTASVSGAAYAAARALGA